MQDARVSRAKNGKSLVIAWFPIPKPFEQSVVTWIAELTQAGFRPDGALFPDMAYLDVGRRSLKLGDECILPMSSKYTV